MDGRKGGRKEGLEAWKGAAGGDIKRIDIFGLLFPPLSAVCSSMDFPFFAGSSSRILLICLYYWSYNGVASGTGGLVSQSFYEWDLLFALRADRRGWVTKH